VWTHSPIRKPRRSQYAIGAVVTLYMNANFKIRLDYQITHYEGGATLSNRPDARVLTPQFALIF
jgi:hypothetical protein